MGQVKLIISFFYLLFISFSANSQPLWDPLTATLKNISLSKNNNALKTSGWQDVGPAINDILNFAFNYDDPQIIYAASRDSGIFKTINGGISWIQINNGISDKFIRSIGVHPKNGNIILAGTFHDGLYRSIDAGVTWNHVIDINDSTIFDIAFNETYPDTVYVATKNSGIYRSFDAGVSWQKLMTGNAIKIIVDSNFPSRTYYLSYNKIYKSENFGNTWTTFFTANNKIISCEINPKNSNMIILGTNPADSLYKTTDMGVHWQRLPFSSIITDIIVNSADTSQIYVSSPLIGVYRSTNSGTNWSNFNNNMVTLCVVELKQHNLDNFTLYASINQGAIKKNNDLSSTINDNLNDRSKYCFLSQNSPNPFDLSTIISYRISTPQIVSLKIYNIFGIEVATLINEYKYPGEYKFIFDAGNLPCGSYIYSINCPNSIATKKMTIIK